jgi:hypothetical protein
MDIDNISILTHRFSATKELDDLDPSRFNSQEIAKFKNSVIQARKKKRLNNHIIELKKHENKSEGNRTSRDCI